ncbi:MAG: Holliday junction branch migration protein RuvA [Clostridia bacterium]|nr:Holliday junction branch migration protein RuvA [Clostridia bacterium]
MFSYIKGSLEVKSNGYIVVECGGIGYKVFMSDKSLSEIGEIGENIKVYTYFKVREDDISLYGFKTDEELRMFEMLLSVSGIGAKSAIVMLSNIEPSAFAFAVISDDVDRITKIPGIGKKTAQRLILELKDKLKSVDIEKEKSEIENKVKEYEGIDEAYAALQVLGYSKREIETAFTDVDFSNMNVEEIIKKGLILLTNNK